MQLIPTTLQAASVNAEKFKEKERALWRKRRCFPHKLTELHITGKKMGQVIFGVQSHILRLQAGMTIFLLFSADATNWTTE